MMDFLQTVESSGFSMFVKESSTAYVAVLAFHTIGLAFLVGISVGTSLRILGAAKQVPLAPLADFFPLMYAGFWINLFTGGVLLLLYPTKYVVDPIIYIKLGAVVLAMLALRNLRAHVFGDGPGMSTLEGARRAKMLAIAMTLFWLIATVAGRITAYDVSTKIQTTIAVVITLAAMLGVGLLLGRSLGWIEPSEEGAG